VQLRTTCRAICQVQIRRPIKGIKIEKYFGKKRYTGAYMRDVEHAFEKGVYPDSRDGLVISALLIAS
jgi:hypothetical protein